MTEIVWEYCGLHVRRVSSQHLRLMPHLTIGRITVEVKRKQQTKPPCRSETLLLVTLVSLMPEDSCLWKKPLVQLRAAQREEMPDCKCPRASKGNLPGTKATHSQQVKTPRSYILRARDLVILISLDDDFKYPG
jgi:hypothetical protein